MDYIYIGKIVNTHGIKGELRLLSDIDNKVDIFKKDNTIYIGSAYEPLIINTYRVHKNYDMLTFNNINDINEVLKYKGKKVYVKNNDFKDMIFDENIIGLDVYTNKYIGKITDILYNGKHKILKINDKFLVPYIDEFINKIDIDNNRIKINNMEGLIDED